MEEKPHIKLDSVSTYRFYWHETADLRVREKAFLYVCIFLLKILHKQNYWNYLRIILFCSFPLVS